MERAYIVSQLSQTVTLKIKCTFDLDRFLVTFRSILGIKEKGFEERAALNDAVNQIIQIIFENYGFRFRLVGTDSSLYLRYEFR